VTLAGKLAATKNARRHGILSRELLLPSENPEEFYQLMDELAIELRPVGTLEYTLVECIAIAMWRQRRLVRAENARALRLQKDGSIPGWQETGGIIEERRSVQDVNELIQELIVIANDHSLSDITIGEFADRFPQAFSLLLNTAGPPDFAIIAGEDADLVVADFYLNLKGWATEQRDQWQKKLDVILRRDALCVPDDSDKLSRYQSALDNEMYKGMRALRQAQSWRFDVLETK
jgi:hypothetical protein